MTNKEVLNELYRKHTTWILMAEKLVPEYYSVTAEDIVQDVYLKIYDELRENKLKTTTIIKEGNPHYGIMYLRIRNIVVDMMRKDKPLYTNNKQDFEDKQIQSEAEFFENIDGIIDNFFWFHKKIFKMYLNPTINIDINKKNKKKYLHLPKKKHSNGQEYVTAKTSLRNIAQATKISYVTVFNKIKECTEEIKKKINEK